VGVDESDLAVVLKFERVDLAKLGLVDEGVLEWLKVTLFVDTD
jgi:hypothetical protein